MSGIRLYLFGLPRLEREGNVVAIRRRKGLALLAYLALHKQPQARETLSTLLWPDFDQSRALSNLRRELSRLKSDIQVEILQADRLQVVLSPEAPLRVDVKEFQDHVGQLANHGYHFPDEACTACYRALTEAVTLHSHRFMEGFQLQDAPQYEEWQFFQAEELSRALADGLHRLLRWHASAGNYAEAIGYGRRWLELDPLHEPAHRELMGLYARAGQQTAALRQYEECQRLLGQELGLQPQQETTSLFEAIRSRHFTEEQVGLVSPSSSRRPPPSALFHAPQQGCTTVGPSPERYRLQEQIAVGGQGEVFLGRDQQTGTTVIIKRLRPELASDGERVARFLREGAALRQLDHPNIVHLLAAFEHEGHHCIVMEYVSGGTLAELLEQTRMLPVERVLALGLELADALSRAHHLGIIHRDLKPGNVLLTEEGKPRLTDFGTARLAQEDVRLTQTGSLVGSPAYMSPEALRGDELDVRSDIWSFGVLLYEMLAGQRPFAGEGIAQILVRILGEPPPPLTTFRDDLPPALLALLEQMLAKETVARPRSMREVAAALEIIQHGGVPPGLDLGGPAASTGTDSLAYRLQHQSRLAKEATYGGQGKMPEAKGSASLSPALLANGRQSPLLPGTQTNNPLPIITLVGRNQELSDLRRLLAQETYRLLTVVGPGGIGKTTLALATVQELAAAFRDGVTFVPLASLTRPEQLAPAIAERLGLEFLEAGNEAEQLLHFLEKRHQLLLLDNFEQLLAAAPLVKELLERCPDLTVLATSREPLNLSLESIYRLGGLAYPEDTTLEDSSFVHLGAVQLLLQQLRRQRPELGLELLPGTEELQQVARICRLVQGMPLALLLAANWIELLSLKEIADEIAGSLDLLEADLHDLPLRQRSVRAVFNGSWQMLDEAAQVAMARLSVFRGPFSRPAAEAVANCSLLMLRSLLDKSWLQRHQDGFELHELVRQYATQRLQALPGGWVTAHAAHAAYYGTLFQEQFSRMKGPEQEEAFRLVRASFDQSEAAWRWLVERGELAQAVEQLLPALYRYCEGHARASELIPLLRLALDSPDLSDPYLRAILLVARGAFFGAGHPIRFESPGDFVPFYWEEGSETWPLALQQKIPPFWHTVICYSHGRVVDPEEAIAALEPLLASLRAQGEEWLLAFGLQHLALLLQLRQRGEDEVAEAVVHLSEALAIMDRLGDGRESGYTLRALGHLRLIQQQLPEAITHWREALIRLEQAGDWVIAAQMHWHIGDAYLQMGQLEAAFGHYHTMSETALAHGNRRFAATVLSKESYEAARYGRFQPAMQRRQQALELAKAGNNPFVEAWCTWEMGELHRLQGNLDEATLWFERSLQLFNRLDDNPGRSFYHRGLADIARIRGEHEVARVYYQKSLQEAEANGHGWAAAYALGALGHMDAALGEPESAVAHCVRALTLARETSDRAISLAVLAAAAQALLSTGNAELALETAAFVADHPVSWNEVRQQAQALQETISLSPSQQAAAYTRARQQHTWQLMVDARLALADLVAVPVG